MRAPLFLMTASALAALLVAPLGIPANAAAAPAELIQSPNAGEGLLLSNRPGRSWLMRPDSRRRRLPVRRGESLTELVEYARGWAAAGTRTTAEGSELLVLKDGATGVARLPAPPGRQAALRVAPVPLASRREFGGVAWLEGEEPLSYRVRVAEWSGADWSPPAEVSTLARGGQAGLVGTVLNDGAWLLVWSASNGQGSELYWSLRQRSGWTAPRRLADANRVPDITPALLATPGGGALLVWARQARDGYRLQAAAFDGDGWRAHRPLGGLAGAFPRFAATAGGIYVVARAPGGWSVLELDEAGRLRRHQTHSAARSGRPALTATDNGLALVWDGAADRVTLGWEPRR